MAAPVAAPVSYTHSDPTRRWQTFATQFLLTPLASVLAPGACILCYHPLIRLTPAPVCDECWADIRSAQACPAPCARCGSALSGTEFHPSADALCRLCTLAPPPFARIVTFATYREKLRQAIHALKFRRIRPIATPLGQMLAQAIVSLAPTAPGSMLVVPVPLHPRRQRARGFNQARLLATAALRTLHISHPDWHLELSPASLVRQRETVQQASLKPRQRRINLEQAFRVARPQQVKGRAILLVDDIVTTGATARACAQSLLDAGAASVFVAALARAQMIFHNGNWIIDDATDAVYFDAQEDFEFSSTLDSQPTPHPT